ncbi:SIR2 family protein [Paraburkholderia kirstenboschensis]|uniref:SIR2 family protein n=1 Tax=Paraburkholderia kirstenboschensis TaxID=1245436 RepID=A0ABZ0EKL6_9BURK|nr:SIR2 family protein [Paraburkholderia kirstenboschensis]WOD16989.1 SIR2 family protein [Paraburkholderia kirstenboschensis]
MDIVENASGGASVKKAGRIEPGMLAFRKPGSERWLPLDERAMKSCRSEVGGALSAEEQDALSRNRTQLADALTSGLQMPNPIVLAGSGTSLRGGVNGPSMGDLWVATMCKQSSQQIELTAEANAICEKVGFAFDNANIEHFLSRCDAYLSIYDDEQVSNFIVRCKATILRMCSEFVEKANLSGHEVFLQKIARRRTRDARLKIFTTNYDLCFEVAASNLGMMVVDGFSYGRHRRFDPSYFQYDFVRRSDESQEFLEGVIHLAKLHGSVSWERDSKGDVHEKPAPDPAHACLIYPTKGKYQQAFVQPHLELLSRFLDSLRKPNTCVVISGFGFNDDHLSEPLVSAIKSNPSLKVFVADFCAVDHTDSDYMRENYWHELSDLAKKGLPVYFINASFQDFAGLIPDLKALTPAEQMANAVRRVRG